MDISSQCIGHETVLQHMQRVMKRKKLAHAYCFVGQKHVGKTTLVFHIAHALFGVPVHKVEHHPDFVHVRPEKNEKTKKTKKHIDVEQIRLLRERVMTAPCSASYRIVYIEHAEKLNEQASNALLKTLEEPPSHTIFFLGVQHEQQIPRTILSRCQTFIIPAVSFDTICQVLSSFDISKEEAVEIARYAHGLPGLATQFVQDMDVFMAYKQESIRFHSFVGKPLYAKLQLVDDIFGDKTDHIAQRSVVITALHTWQLALRDMMVSMALSHESAIHPEWTYGRLVQVYDTIEEATQLLQKNIHPRLLIENILLTIP